MQVKFGSQNVHLYVLGRNGKGFFAVFLYLKIGFPFERNGTGVLVKFRRIVSQFGFSIQIDGGSVRERDVCPFALLGFHYHFLLGDNRCLPVEIEGRE